MSSLVSSRIAALRQKLHQIRQACRRIGQAVDRVEATRFTAAEKPARVALEKAAKSLRNLMAKRHG